MGLFDRFRKRIHEVADETDQDALSVDASSEEAKELLQPPQVVEAEAQEEWEDLEEVESIPEEEPKGTTDDDWDTWDDDEPMVPVALTKKERKLLERQERERKKAAALAKKAMKKRGAVEMARPKGSKVDLSMMRTTTGRQLVEVKQAPKGSSKTATIELEQGKTVDIDLGGGVVSEGGRVIKPGQGLDDLLEELEWALLESDISQQATSAIIDSLRNALIGAHILRQAEYALGNDVPQDLIRSAFNANGWRSHQHRLNLRLTAGDCGIGDEAANPLQIHRELGNVLHHAPGDQLTNTVLGSWNLAFGQRRDCSGAGIL